MTPPSRTHCERRDPSGDDCGLPATHVLAWRDEFEALPFGPEILMTFVCEEHIGDVVPRDAVGASVRRCVTSTTPPWREPR